jgi:subtilase family serine protease
MIRISGVTRRVAAAVVLCSLAAQLFGSAPSVAASAGAQGIDVKAVCPAATPGTAQCLALLRTDIAARPASAVSALTPPSGYGPADIQSAYALPSGSTGTGLTVAVVTAYDLPTAEADLGVYRSQFGLPSCTVVNGCFRKVDQNGGASYPAVDKNWGVETALDIDMVSAACPNCHILLVEANDNQNPNLGAAVNTAVSLGAIAVSTSYGGPEWSGETSDDTYYNHPGVAITAATGDCGYDCTGVYKGSDYNSVEYPAASPYVVAVGGTSLARDASTRGWTESAWGDANGGTGSGCSLYEPKPTWQHDTGCAMRTQADVSAVADGPAGLAVYVNGAWSALGGTSAASPIIAATFALAGRPAAGTNPASYLYGNPAGLNDVIGGNNDVTYHSCTVTYLCNGVAGYDGPTGLGTPNGTGAFTAPGSTTTTPVPATYHPITPARLLDTRTGNGLSGKLVANTPRTFQVSGRGGVPSNATGVTGNVTVVNPTASWAVYLGPDPIASPTSSTINFSAGQVLANGVTVALGSGGTLSATYMSTTGKTTDLVFDVTGYFTPDSSGATYHPVTPARLLDTRVGNGLSARLSANTPATFQVSGRGGVPANATGVTGNVTVVNPTASWAVFVGPDPIASPTSSTINFSAGQVLANGLTVALGSGGTLSATYMSMPGNTTDLVFDVTGYFTADSTGARYVPITPARLLDTRIGNGLSARLSANTPAIFQVTGRGGVPAGATGVTGNVTVVNPTSSWAVFLGPNPTGSPTSSTINFGAGQVLANGLTVALGSGGTLSATYMSMPGNTTDLVFDVTGYFTP